MGLIMYTYSLAEDHIPTTNLSKQNFRNSSQKGLLNTGERERVQNDVNAKQKSTLYFVCSYLNNFNLNFFIQLKKIQLFKGVKNSTLEHF